jgi:hypothetical protein
MEKREVARVEAEADARGLQILVLTLRVVEVVVPRDARVARR